jgi:hypothetical protein
MTTMVNQDRQVQLLILIRTAIYLRPPLTKARGFADAPTLTILR